ncbi:MAG TPA: folate-binding protein [Mariprofundaceae bacterium]|nr:folate-binding protein [Mariprofundaceae bacterium]
MNSTTNNVIPKLSTQQAEWLQHDHISCIDSRLAVLKASGEGLDEYLQGQLTQDLGRLSASLGAYCVVLTPQGKAVSDLWIMQGTDGERILIAEESYSVNLVARLRQYALRAPLRMGVVANMTVLSVQGVETDSILRRAGLPVPSSERLSVASLPDREITAMRFPDAAGDGVRLVLPVDLADSFVEKTGHCVDIDCLEAARIVHGTPRFGVDWDQRVHPLNANLIEYDGVSFDKGCYVGQEVTSRMHWRGGIRKALYRIRLPALPESLPVSLHLAPNAPVGHVSSIACDGDGTYYGIAQLKIEDVDAGKVFHVANDDPVEVLGRCSPV